MTVNADSQVNVRSATPAEAVGRINPLAAVLERA
jgi:hypothetical protein